MAEEVKSGEEVVEKKEEEVVSQPEQQLEQSNEESKEEEEEEEREIDEKEREQRSKEVEALKANLKLQSKWTIWISKHSKNVNDGNYESSLDKIGTFDSVPEFWGYYSHLLRPSELPKDHNYSVFRDEVKPMWENYPKGGCWNIRRRKKSPVIDRLWEELLFGLIGEQFEEPDVVGIVISTRSKEDVLSIWIRENSSLRFAVGEKLKKILSLNTSTIEYKNHSSSIKDRSTFRNGKQYAV